VVAEVDVTLEQDGLRVDAGERSRERVRSRPISRRAALRPLLWRLHFFGGFLAAPVVLSLALTGILYAWNPQIEASIYRQALTAVAAGPPRPLGEQVAAASAAYPGWEVRRVVPAAPAEGAATTSVMLGPPGATTAGFGPPEGAVSVYVDPASAAVTGEIVEADRPDEWLRSLHSSWRIGPLAEPVTELAASWVLVSLLTGLYLWWPRNVRSLLRSMRMRRPGRVRMRSLHTTLGIVLFVPLIALVGSGLSWTTYAGGWIDIARAQLSSQTPSVSTDLTGGAAAASGGGHSGHGGVHEGMAMPSVADPVRDSDRVFAAARDAGLTGVLVLTPPRKEHNAWTVAVNDNRWPIQRATVAVDPATGEVTDRVAWAGYPLLAKATTLGIAFHQASLFGLVNQIGLTLLAVFLIVLIVAGYRMWWLRRPRGAFGVPPRAGPLLRTTPLPLLLGFTVLMVLLPTLGVSFVAYLIIERLVRFFRRPAEVTP